MATTLQDLLSSRGGGGNTSLQDILGAAREDPLTSTDRGNFSTPGEFGTDQNDIFRGHAGLSTAVTGGLAPLAGEATSTGMAQLLKSLLQGGGIDQDVLGEQLRASERGTQSQLQDFEDRNARTGIVGPGGATAAAIGEAGFRRNAAIETAEQDKAQDRLSQRLALLGDLAIQPGLQAGGIESGRRTAQAQIDAQKTSTFDKVLGTLGQGAGLAAQLGLAGATGGASMALPAIGTAIGGGRIGL